MNYEEIVHIIVQVTGLSVPVYFNEEEAMFKGSPYFGLGKHSWDIWEAVGMDLFDDPMCELTDFLENQHIKYYHIGLPEKILKDSDKYIYSVVEELLHEKGIAISLSEPLLETFIILHEFGHAHQLFVMYEGDLEEYLQQTQSEISAIDFQLKTDGLSGTEQGLRLHKSKSTEEYADHFAIIYFPEVIKQAKIQGIM